MNSLYNLISRLQATVWGIRKNTICFSIPADGLHMIYSWFHGVYALCNRCNHLLRAEASKLSILAAHPIRTARDFMPCAWRCSCKRIHSKDVSQQTRTRSKAFQEYVEAHTYKVLHQQEMFWSNDIIIIIIIIIIIRENRRIQTNVNETLKKKPIFWSLTARWISRILQVSAKAIDQ